jgi:DNA-binding MarR family transcriptional regulator
VTLDAASGHPALDVHELRILVLKLARRIRAQRGDEGMSDTQLSVLFMLERHGERTLGELAEHERVAPPSMTRTVNALVAAGYVSREQSELDGRKLRLNLTPAGIDLIAETRRRRNAWFSERLAELTSDEQRQLADISGVLRQLADS